MELDPLNLGVEGTQWGNRTVPLQSQPDPSNQSNRVVPPTKGFRFSHPRVPIDWKKILSSEIEAIERRGDVERLAKFLPTVALGDVEKSVGGSDAVAHPALIKAFKQAQLASQYLIHCQTSMEKQVSLVNDEITSLERVGRKLEEKENRKDEKLKELKKESRAQRRLIAQYHRMLRKHNPDLAGRIVGHGDGSISLLERGTGIQTVVNTDEDLKFGNASVMVEEDDDFYVNPESLSVSTGGEEESTLDSRFESSGAMISPKKGKAAGSGATKPPESPEGKLIRSSIEEMPSPQAREELEKFRQLSPDQKRNPILESLRISGELDFDDSDSCSEIAL